MSPSLAVSNADLNAVSCQARSTELSTNSAGSPAFGGAAASSHLPAGFFSSGGGGFLEVLDGSLSPLHAVTRLSIRSDPRSLIVLSSPVRDVPNSLDQNM